MSNRPNPSRALRRFSKENSMPVLSPHALFEAHLNVSELSRSLPFIRRCLASNWPTVTRNVESLSSGSVDAGTRCSGATGRTVHQRRLWEPSLAVAYPMRSAGAFRKLLTVRKRRYLAPRLQLPHGVRTHFENGKSLIGEASLGECYDPLWPHFFHDSGHRVLSECGGSPILDCAVPHRLDDVDATRDPIAHVNSIIWSTYRSR